MPRTKTSTTRRQRQNGRVLRSKGENNKYIGIRNNNRSRINRSTDLPTANPVVPANPKASQSICLKPSSSSKKRKRDAPFEEDKGIHKSPRKYSQPLLGPPNPLNQTNLEKLEKLMNPPTIDMDGSSEKGGKRRRSETFSRQSSYINTPQETASANTQSSSKSTYLAAFKYRLGPLMNARILFRHGPLSTGTQYQVNDILHRELPDARQMELDAIAETLCSGVRDALNGASREDDYVEPIHAALTAMDDKKRFLFPRKGDWDPNLKPSIQQRSWNFSFLEQPPDGISSTQKDNGPQIDASLPSPTATQGRLNPPTTQPNHVITAIKTPRPDITACLRHNTLVDELIANDLSAGEAHEFLKKLQENTYLFSAPIPAAEPGRFPTFVVEGKAYSTGKPIMEAQNQAAVSGSCMINLQLKLIELTEKALTVVKGAGSSVENKSPLAFSLCTEGPIIELWVHYTLLEDGVRTYNMSILDICHASLPGRVKDLLGMVDKVMQWGNTEYAKDMAKKVAFLVNATKVGTS